MSSLETLLDRDRILDRVNELFVGTDERDWPRVRGCFTDSVAFDMTSLAGGEPSTRSADEIVDGWREGLAPLQAVHHQTGNFRVTVSGARASVFCYGIATHFRPTHSGRNVRTFVGSYDLDLVRDGPDWRISGFKFNLKYVDGNLQLEKEP